MNAALDSRDLERLQAAITKALGLRFDDGRQTSLLEAAQRRSEARRISLQRYVDELASAGLGGDEALALARDLTVGETYFFRHREQFEALREIALPERAAAIRATRPLRLLSAGCASGEEAYSLSILAQELGLQPGSQLEVHACDLNPDAISKAKAGVYSAWSLRETSVERRERWFSFEQRSYRLRTPAFGSVTFHQHNLAREAAPFPALGGFDVVFCRNVLMYLTSEHAAAIIGRFARWLAPGGFLFLGHAENLRGLSKAFGLRHSHNAFYYQLRGEGAEPALDLSYTHTPSQAPVTPGLSNDAWVQPWLDAVERSSQRIAELSSRALDAPADGFSAATKVPPGLERPLELLRSERFAEALALLQEPRKGERVEPSALLLRAALLTLMGDFSEAERTCQLLLEHDELNAGAHYLLALCSERGGRPERAVEHDETAVHLDPTFAMPHLHLGLMARRRRESVRARAELSVAMTLLEGEEASRLLLFGGGFGRKALLSLCRLELANLEEAP